MNKLYLSVCFFLVIVWVTGCNKTGEAPEKYGALPSERQLAWHKLENYAFLHFTVNTFTDKEWGYGDEAESVFNPTDFDADQIVGTLKKAGFKGAILTAKHHDGFCLWPSMFTEHSVKNSKWKNGKGDVVREISDACKRHGIKFGVYLSPWDRNHADYGTPKYVEYYRNQLRELLTGYGEIFEIWFDGANGGDGYYGGKREVRKIDASNYYEWEKTLKIVRELQPNAAVFSDAGPDIRWVGNEGGYSNDTCWATYTPSPREGFTRAWAGTTKDWEGEKGHMNGKYWMPAETDVSIRKGWFYHDSENSDKVKSVDSLVKIYFKSVGNGTSLNLNLPPDKRGKIHPTDSTNLMGLKAYLDEGYKHNFLADSKISAGENGGSVKISSYELTDSDDETYWYNGKNTNAKVITFELEKEAEFNCFMLKEYIPLGQRVKSFSIEVFDGEKWKEMARGATIGYKRLLKFPPQKAKKIRVLIKDALATPLIAETGLYRFPDLKRK
ncbi:hypothetical protein DYBT9275_00953 [Dyadobacter sp. CECT 9275]|uniref:alpha-L-fucosidase n=1 Tax=Dyadobacter helix TaxID=2822344 RepID=A0A916N4L9_9BACT|nr:alpha-L-fucosidase [Dyadobacter sp. CECT 9275]CAG4992393.1 hypothetical protein DYBT9275_00953 [Dyadobacter sp. CECT 9275]